MIWLADRDRGLPPLKGYIMFVVINLSLTILNLAMGFINIDNGSNPYIIAVNFFAGGFAAFATIATAIR